jgi:OFA family oxalate/formate antiporter-like MFS transporter
VKERSKGVAAVAGCSLAMFWPGALAFGYPGVLSATWREMFSVGQGAIGGLMFFVLASLGIFMFLVGRWQERYGPRAMMTVGAVLCGLSMIVLAFAVSLWMVYLWGFLNGTASCFVYMPALTTVQRWFPEHRGLVSGIVNLVFGVSAAIMSPLFGRMLAGLGYRTMNLVVVGLALVTGLVAARFAFQAPQPRVSSAGVQGLSVRASLHTLNFWLIWLAWASLGAAGIAMVTLSVSFGRSKGYPAETAVVILTTFNLANGLSRIFAGYFSDRIRRTLTITATATLAGASYLILPYLSSLGLIALMAGFIGLAFGTLFTVSAPLAVDCFGLKHFGAVFGLIFTAYGFVSGLLGPLLSGHILDSNGDNYVPVFTYLGVLCLLAAGFMTFVRARRPVTG